MVKFIYSPLLQNEWHNCKVFLIKFFLFLLKLFSASLSNHLLKYFLIFIIDPVSKKKAQDLPVP